MAWEIVYYNENVQSILSAWPVGIRAVYARITERISVFGPNLGMPFTRALGNGLFEIIDLCIFKGIVYIHFNAT